MFSRTQFEVFDLVQLSSTTSNCFTRSYGHRMKSSGSILYLSKDKTQLDEAYQRARHLIESDDLQNPEHSRSIDKTVAELMMKLKFRLFTPKEVARLMCFPIDRLIFSEKLTSRQCYRLLGNSVNVAIVRHLLQFLLKSWRKLTFVYLVTKILIKWLLVFLVCIFFCKCKCDTFWCWARFCFWSI